MFPLHASQTLLFKDLISVGHVVKTDTKASPELGIEPWNSHLNIADVNAPNKDRFVLTRGLELHPAPWISTRLILGNVEQFELDSFLSISHLLQFWDKMFEHLSCRIGD